MSALRWLADLATALLFGLIFWGIVAVEFVLELVQRLNGYSELDEDWDQIP